MITSIWGLLAVYAGCSSLAIWLGNNTRIGKKWGYVLIANLLGFILVNIGVIAITNEISIIIIRYLVPIAVVMILFQADIRRILQVGLKFLIVMMVTTVIILACCIGFGLLFNVGPESAKMWGALAGDYVGNMQTLGVLVAQLGLSPEMTAAISASQAVYFVLYSIVMLSLYKFGWFKNFFKSYKDLGKTGIQVDGDIDIDIDNPNKDFKVNPSEVAILGGAAIVIIWVGDLLGSLTGWLSMIFYVTIAIVLANTTKISKFKVNDSIGVWLFNMFMVSVGAGAKITTLMTLSPMIVVGNGVILVASMILMLLFIKLAKMPIEYGMLSHMACVGGAVSTPPMAKAYNWNDLVLPGLLVGILGQVLGPYYGLICYSVLNGMM